MIGGRVLDHTAISDAASGKTSYIRALLRVAVSEGIVLDVPATALAEAWANADQSQYPALDLIVGLPIVVVDDLTADTARDVGLLAAPMVTNDLPAAHAVHLARTRGWPVVTANPRLLHELDPGIELEELP